MFSKILIANRGEIACRVIRGAQRMGIATVAVYSEADEGALHVELADEAVAIGPAPAAESYLVIDKIVAACQETGAQAVHPGFGFLAENAGFVTALEAAGIVFIGPGTRAIRAMGDKIESKRLAAKAGVSIVPGHLELIADEDEAARVSAEIGYPVMIKASSGGGGKGMRVASDKKSFLRQFHAAQSEAQAAFDDPDVYLEKCIVRPKHIEFQVFGDQHGRVVHLGERDCSIQRRHQKLIEEAPSPVVTPKMREEMGRLAVLAAEGIDYVGAGTVEFLVDADGSFYFIEMNTRIQVEHPVTEITTGLDLVKEQVRVAAGEPLSFPDEIPQVRGHAIEFRVNAEDSSRNFAPSPGLITTFHPPGGPGVRLDTHLYSGYHVPPYYDSLLAKLIVSGRDREEAIVRARHALESFVIEGITTTIPFLAEITRDEQFVAGGVDTGFVDRFLAEQSGN